MELVDLKQEIMSGEIDDSFKIFIYNDNKFLVQQYINEICNNKQCIQNNISSIYEPKMSAMSLVMDYQSKLNILYTDTFEERAENYSIFTNTIVVCTAVDKKLKDALADYITEFPKLEPWQIKMYFNTLCPELADDDCQWLINATGNNIYRALNELDKILIFPSKNRKEIFNEVRYSKSDLFTQTIFDLTEAILKQDKLTILEFFRHRDLFDLDPIAIVNILLNNLKKLALIRLNSGATTKDLNVSPKQYSAFKSYLYRNYSADMIFKAIEFLSSIDLRLKSSELDLNKNELLDYIICNLG